MRKLIGVRIDGVKSLVSTFATQKFHSKKILNRVEGGCDSAGGAPPVHVEVP